MPPETKDSATIAPQAEARKIIQNTGFLQLPEEQAEAFLAAIVEHSTDAIYSFDVHGIVLTWNPAAERLFGYSSAEMIGQPAALLTPAAEAEKLEQKLGRIHAGERLQHFETVRLNKDGSCVDVALTLSPVYRQTEELVGFSAIARDIRDRRAAEQERQRLIALVENSPDLIGLADFAQRLVFLNRAGRRMVNVPGETDLRTTSIIDYFPEEERQRLSAEVMPALSRQGTWSGELRLRNFQTGTRLPVFCNLFLIGNSKKQPAFFACVARDLSERKRAEAALIQSERLAASGRMAATVAHEINNPLESIINLLYLLEREPLTLGGREYLRIAGQELLRVSQIARQTLGFYRGSSSAGLVCVKDALESVLDLFAAKFQAKNIVVRRSLEAEGCLNGVSGEFRQVFSNLIANAIDAMPKGGTLSVATLDTNLHESPAVEVRVEDTGEGVPQAQLQSIFEPFFTTKTEKGTGLGLWVSRNIIHRYGGEIAAYTEENPRRTIFSVMVPLHAKAA